jgi:TolA-binding protein
MDARRAAELVNARSLIAALAFRATTLPSPQIPSPLDIQNPSGGDLARHGPAKEETIMPEKKPASEMEDTKEALQRRLEVQLEEWSASIDELQAKAERKEFDEQIRRKYYERAQALRDRLSEASDRLQELKKSSEKTWKGLKGDMGGTMVRLVRIPGRAEGIVPIVPSSLLDPRAAGSQAGSARRRACRARRARTPASRHCSRSVCRGGA